MRLLAYTQNMTIYRDHLTGAGRERRSANKLVRENFLEGKPIYDQAKDELDLFKKYNEDAEHERLTDAESVIKGASAVFESAHYELFAEVSIADNHAVASLNDRRREDSRAYHKKAEWREAHHEKFFSREYERMAEDEDEKSRLRLAAGRKIQRMTLENSLEDQTKLLLDMSKSLGEHTDRLKIVVADLHYANAPYRDEEYLRNSNARTDAQLELCEEGGI
jgi:predicted ATP-dependent protease